MMMRNSATLASTILLVLAGCDSASRFRATGPVLGATVVAPLGGQEATNQQQFLERIRHLPKTAAWERRTFVAPTAPGEPLKYLFFRPKNFQPEQNYPLVLSLHGGAPHRNFEDMVEPYLPGLAYGPGRLIANDTQTNHPCFVVAPWSNGRNWDAENLWLITQLLDSLQKEFHVDAKRVYVTGQSMGGFGTFAIITRYPDRFAAAVPICGGGEPRDAAKAKDIPIWAFHGTSDAVVPVDYTRQMIVALRKAGATPRYWEYQGADHSGTAERAYCEPGLISWMFAQSKP